MKKIKFLLLVLTITMVGLYSCTDNDPIENEVVATKSISLRATLNYIKKANNISGKNTTATQDQALCFGFVYPITLSYNDGTQVTVANFQGLLQILTNENSTLYIDGIVFPFQVQQEGAITTINNEAEFFALLQDCVDVPVVNDFVFDFSCYSIVYPIQIINANNETVTVNNQTELMQYVSTPTGTSTYQLNIVFPISVIQNDQTIVINDLYEFFELNNDCSTSSCVCPMVYQPVCVQTPAGPIVEYSNACFAECDGYTSSDFVNCDGSSNPCSCPALFDPVCVQTSTGVVQYDNACRAECAGFTSADFITCGVSPNPTFGDLLGTCFTMNYPVQIQHQGALVTANNDGQLLQYYFPNLSPIPALVYPVTVNFYTPVSVISVTVANQAAFQTAIDNNCN